MLWLRIGNSAAISLWINVGVTQWQADHMATAPSCHLFSPPVGTCLCAHCMHGREGAPPEKGGIWELTDVRTT